MIELDLYRALPVKDVVLTGEMRGDLISEAASRVMASSKANRTPYFWCFTEDIRIAVKYSKKPGYSGKIIKIRLKINDEGQCEITNDPGAKVYRTWCLTDWLQLAKLSHWPEEISNVNYNRLPIKFENVITYRGRSSARAYAHSDRGFIVHSGCQLVSEILSEEEIVALTSKPVQLKSYRAIKYDFSDVASKKAITSLIEGFKAEKCEKAHSKNMIAELELLLS